MDELGYSKKSVYYQPPEFMQLAYPCIVYSGNGGDTAFADNVPYIKRNDIR